MWVLFLPMKRTTPLIEFCVLLSLYHQCLLLLWMWATQLPHSLSLSCLHHATSLVCELTLLCEMCVSLHYFDPVSTLTSLGTEFLLVSQPCTFPRGKYKVKMDTSLSPKTGSNKSSIWVKSSQIKPAITCERTNRDKKSNSSKDWEVARVKKRTKSLLAQKIWSQFFRRDISQ